MALLFTILCGLVALSIGYFINYFTKGHFVYSTEAVLDAEIRYIEALGANKLPDSDQLYLFLNEDGALPKSISADISRLVEGILIFDYSENSFSTNKRPTNQRRYAGKIHTLPDNRKLLVGTDITEIAQHFRFMQWIGVASIGFVMMVVFVSYLISIFVVSGTNKIAETAQNIIDTGDLSRRVDIGFRWDDLSNMAIVLNTLLARIQELMQGVRQVSDNIAHDLRTPLTRIRHHIETLQKRYNDEAHTELIEETDQLLNVFNALLRISRIESEKQRCQFTEINLKTLLEDVIAFYAPLVEEKFIELSITLEEAQLKGDRDLLFQMYANLLDNAVKFTPNHGAIHISLYTDKQKITTCIADTGIGIDEGDKDKIFHRCYRGESSRSSSGTGLGLSLASAVVDLHEGRIYAENCQPGLKIITIL